MPPKHRSRSLGSAASAPRLTSGTASGKKRKTKRLSELPTSPPKRVKAAAAESGKKKKKERQSSVSEPRN